MKPQHVLDPWRRQHNREIDGCFGSSDCGYETKSKNNHKFVPNWACDGCLSAIDCRALAKHRAVMYQEAKRRPKK